MLHAHGFAILSDCSKTELWMLRWPTGVGLDVSLHNVLSAINMVQECAKSATPLQASLDCAWEDLDKHISDASWLG